MTALQNLQTIVIGTASTHVSSGAEGKNGLSVDQRIDANNDGKVDYVVHRDTRTITFAKQFLTAKPQMCSVLAKTFHMSKEVRPQLNSDQRQFDAGKQSALEIFDELKSALRHGKTGLEGSLLTFRGKDGVERSVRALPTKDGRLAGLTISGADGKHIRIEDPKLLKAVQDSVVLLHDGTLVADLTPQFKHQLKIK